MNCTLLKTKPSALQKSPQDNKKAGHGLWKNIWDVYIYICSKKFL